MTVESDDFVTPSHPSSSYVLPEDKYITGVTNSGMISEVFSAGAGTAAGFKVSVTHAPIPASVGAIAVPKKFSRAADATISWLPGTQPGGELMITLSQLATTTYCFAAAESGAISIPSSVIKALPEKEIAISISRVTVKSIPERADGTQAVSAVLLSDIAYVGLMP